MGVRADWPELAALLDKGLASVSEQEHQALRQKWLSFRRRARRRLACNSENRRADCGSDHHRACGHPVANRRLKRQVEETMRKDAALKVQLAFQQTLMDTIPNPILFKDADARIYGCNRAYEETFGVKREEMLGCSALELESFSPALRQKLYDDDMALLKSPGIVHEEVRVPFADGKEHVVFYWKTAFNLPDGSIGGILTRGRRRHRYQAARRSGARSPGCRRRRESRQELLPRHHEPRDPHADECGDGHAGTAGPDAGSTTTRCARSTSCANPRNPCCASSTTSSTSPRSRPANWRSSRKRLSVGAVLDSVFMVYSGVASSKNLLLKKYLDPAHQSGRACRSAPAPADPQQFRQQCIEIHRSRGS